MRVTTLTLLAAALFAGCSSKSLTVRDARAGNVELVEGKTFQKVYFVPFSLSEVKLEGAHGEGDVIAANKAKWFVHVAAGAQRRMKRRMKGSQVVIVGSGPSDHERKVMDKLNVTLEWVDAAPDGALVVSGRYVSSREVSGSARFWGGSFSGKSWTRATVGMRVGPDKVFDCTVDGKNMGGGWSWGYETLGANEALGHGIVDVLSAVQQGKKVKSK